MLLELLQLADSALPVGTAAHSFGLETLGEEEFLTPERIGGFLDEHLFESGAMETSFVRRAWRQESLTSLSAEFDARRLARESREASLKMGRRFAELVNTIAALRLPLAIHYPVAFGAAGAALQIPEDDLALAYLQQSVTGLISACQRMMPLGQLAASRILWNLRPSLLNAAERSKSLEVACFSPLPELGSMRHSQLETRLFIS